MEISEKLALEFNTILSSHSLTLLLLISFSGYIFYRGKKTPLLNSYLLVVGMISLWMTAKIFKTLSPSIELRWFFIIIQYFAVDSLGFCLLIFAHLYRYDRMPSMRQLLIWSVLPFVAFLVLVTNPLHMTFYSYFDIYKDRFGISFYFSQSVQYLYLLAGIVLLSKGFTQQPGFKGKKNLGYIFSILVLIPLITNAYYILFKMNMLPWIFPFPVFDFTPITASVSLILFIIPTLTYRIFDISPISLNKLYDIVPQGLVFIDSKYRLYGSNKTFLSILKLDKQPLTLKQLFESEIFINDNIQNLQNLFNDFNQKEVEISLSDGRHLSVQKHIQKKGYLICLSEITEISKNRRVLDEQKETLKKINDRLIDMADNAKDLAISRTKTKMAQNVHDILGHSLTVLIGAAEIAAENDAKEALEKMNQIEELMTGSLNDMKNTLNGKTMNWDETTLIKSLEYLKNESITIDIQTQGQVYELNCNQTEAVYRLCQEAVTNSIKHGKAKNIYLILRFQQSQFEIFAVDNGSGCMCIKKNFGLLGIESRFAELAGRVDFASNGEVGFTIHAILPRPIHY